MYSMPGLHLGPPPRFSYIVIFGNRKQGQAYGEQINCKSWLKFLSTVSLNLLPIIDSYDSYDYMRTRLKIRSLGSDRVFYSI